MITNTWLARILKRCGTSHHCEAVRPKCTTRRQHSQPETLALPGANKFLLPCRNLRGNYPKRQTQQPTSAKQRQSMAAALAVDIFLAPPLLALTFLTFWG